MIREIENRRSIRKYRSDEIDRKLIEEIIYSATLAPSAKNRQPWKFIVYQGEAKDKLVEVMRHVHIAKLNGRLCGAKRPHSVSEQPNFYQSLQSNPYNDSSHPSGGE